MSSAFSQFIRNQRFWLTGPATLIVSFIVMLAMAAWFPPGVGKVNNIIVPLVMFPLIWAWLFFYTYLTDNCRRAWGMLIGLFMINGAILAAQFLG